MKIPFIKIEQPIGTFYISAIRADILNNLVEVRSRFDDKDKGIQREESQYRINEIADYCSDPDATFPTPIIISVYPNAGLQIVDEGFLIDEIGIIGEVIDGQHRLKGISKSGYANRFELPIILMFNLIEEEKAYVFSIINSKQTKVSMSLIYDLFALSRHRSPQKTAHEIARSLNKMEESPFYNRLKMLGKKEDDQAIAVLSQGTFVQYLLRLISKNPDLDSRLIKKNEELKDDKSLPLREYFINQQDQYILKILLNLFNALKNTFPSEWENPKDNILWKTTGFGAIIGAFNEMYKKGDERDDLTESFFSYCFERFKDLLDKKELKLNSEHFPSNAQQQTKLSSLIIESLEQ
ncbi:DGQHR domain-containing protein [Dysgonomonas reticulitermitis]